jgi:hypothetical protein
MDEAFTNKSLYNSLRAAGVAQSVHRLGYGLDDRGSIPGRDNDGIFSHRHSAQTGLGPTKPPIQWVPGALSQGGKATEA